jgi:hypothetical protein
MRNSAILPYANVDDHVAEAGALHKAMLPLGFLTAFCFHHGLCSPQFLQEHDVLLARVRYQEGQVSELFAANRALLKVDDLTPKGLNFLRGYLPKLSQDYKTTFGDACYEIEDSWENYQRFAKVLVRAHLGAPEGRGMLGLAQRIRSSWIKLWQ